MFSFALAAQAPASATPARPDRDYLLFVGSEGNDAIAMLRFGPAGLVKEREFKIGTNPTELAGPHGVAVAPDGKSYFVTTAHGMPGGSMWKFSTVGDSAQGKVMLGNFPATVQLSPDGLYAWTVNFNLYGDMVPSSVSVVYAPDMVEIARIKTCVMPHGSRLSPNGSRHYSACMMDDLLVEIDATRLGVTRHFMLGKGSEMGMTGAPKAGGMAGMPGMSSMPGMSHDNTAMAAAVSCSPTWAQPSVDGSKVWVACNKSNELVQIDVASWKMDRRFPAGEGVYNLAVTPDGKLIVGTNKKGKSVSVFDAASGKILATIPMSRRIPSGLVISPDNRYAFITLEGVGSEPGTVEAVDLVALRSVATVDVGPQAGGIDIWRVIAPGK